MAASMQSIFLSNSVIYGAGKNLGPAKYAPTSLRYPSLRVRSMAENGLPEEQSSTEESKIPTPPPLKAATPTSPPPSAKPSRPSTKFGDVFAFSGPAPERINGRLAMVGFVSALAVELSKGQDFFSQISDGGASLFVATSILLSVASLIPLFKGVSVESKSNGLMTSDAELWNGRFAMLGLVALAFTEYVKGGTLI